MGLGAPGVSCRAQVAGYGPGACLPLTLWCLVLHGPSFLGLGRGLCPGPSRASTAGSSLPCDKASSRGDSWHCRIRAAGATLAWLRSLYLGFLHLGAMLLWAAMPFPKICQLRGLPRGLRAYVRHEKRRITAVPAAPPLPDSSCCLTVSLWK